MGTLKEAMDVLNEARHKRAVMESVTHHLYDYIPHEGADTFAMKSSGLGEVPERIIQVVIDELEEKFTRPLEEEIQRIERLETHDGEETEEGGSEADAEQKGSEQKSGKGPAKGKGKGRSAKDGKRVSRKATKGIRLRGRQSSKQRDSDDAGKSEGSSNEPRAA